jgi:hypothetical protein
MQAFVHVLEAATDFHRRITRPLCLSFPMKLGFLLWKDARPDGRTAARSCFGCSTAMSKLARRGYVSVGRRRGCPHTARRRPERHPNRSPSPSPPNTPSFLAHLSLSRPTSLPLSLNFLFGPSLGGFPRTLPRLPFLVFAPPPRLQVPVSLSLIAELCCPADLTPPCSSLSRSALLLLAVFLHLSQSNPCPSRSRFPVFQPLAQPASAGRTPRSAARSGGTSPGRHCSTPRPGLAARAARTLWARQTVTSSCFKLSGTAWEHGGDLCERERGCTANLPLVSWSWRVLRGGLPSKV